jgi:hypothetical protein
LGGVDERQGEDLMLEFTEYLKTMAPAFAALALTVASLVSVASPAVSIEIAPAYVAAGQPQG